MKLWRDHYAPEGWRSPATPVRSMCRLLTGLRHVLIVKVVNPGQEKTVPWRLSVPGKVSSAVARVVAPGSLDARNTLAEPSRVKTQDLAVRIDGAKVLVEMPALSAAVITIAVTKDK